MAQGFALVALKQGRRVEEKIPPETLAKIKEEVGKISKIGDVQARSIKRYHGTEILSPFNVRIDFQVPQESDLEATFESIDETLRKMKYSHSEGYG